MKPPASSSDLALSTLVAVLTLMMFELIRSSGPLIDLAYTRGGVLAASTAALVTYLAPGPLTALLLRAAAPGRVLVVGVVSLAALRLLVQGMEGTGRFVLGLATVAVGVAVLTLAVAVLAGRPGGGAGAARVVCAGAAAGVGLQLALGTWDAYWRHTVLGWSVASGVVALLVVCAVLAARGSTTTAPHGVGRLWALGPFLALGAMLLANPAFASSQASVPLAVAGPVHGLGLLLAAWSVTRSARLHRAVALVLLVLLVLLVGWVLSVDAAGVLGGGLVLLALVAAQVIAAGLLGVALTPDAEMAHRSWPGVPVSSSLVGMGTILPLLLYQLAYTMSLDVPNQLALVAAAAALGLGASSAAGRAGVPGDDAPRRRGGRLLVVACGGVLVVGSLVAGTAWLSTSRAPVPVAGDAVVLSWNVHYGVSPAGAVDLEALAATIEAQEPDVVLLQEVSRGWVMGGGVDMATWLSNRLGRTLAFAPAADRQFGNVILSHHGLSDVEVHPLPYGDGPQDRSALSALVPLGDGDVRVVSVHLQSGAAGTPTRLFQLETLLADLGPDGSGPPLVVGGDFNARPGRPEIELMADRGYVSAIDSVGDDTALTNPNPHPDRRIDWIFGRGTPFTRAYVLSDPASDHLPIVATLTP